MGKNNYSLEELVDSKSFKDWVLDQATDTDTRYWNNWIKKSEVNRRLAIKAVHEIFGFSFSQPELPDLDEEWAKVLKTANQSHTSGLRLIPASGRLVHFISRAAAAILILVTVGIGAYVTSKMYSRPQKEMASLFDQTISTGNNQIKTVDLPDGIKISLKSNSTIKYVNGWISSHRIRVKLDGEAYFSIVREKKVNGPEFEVITPQGVIKDIGTKFDVTAARNRTRVVLEEGSVQIDPKGKTKLYGGRKIEMKPGEMVFLSTTEGFTKKEVNPTLYTSWATGHLLFDNTSVSKFAERIHEMYDVKVVISNNRLKNKELNGSVYYRDLPGLVKAVSQVLDAPVYRSGKGDSIFIGRPLVK